MLQKPETADHRCWVQTLAELADPEAKVQRCSSAKAVSPGADQLKGWAVQRLFLAVSAAHALGCWSDSLLLSLLRLLLLLSSYLLSHLSSWLSMVSSSTPYGLLLLLLLLRL